MDVQAPPRWRSRFGSFSIAKLIAVLGVVLVAWLVLVPLVALFYTAFAEDTIYGPGDFTFENFINAYSQWHLLKLFWNSLVFAGGSALLTLVLVGFVAWSVEPT